MRKRLLGFLVLAGCYLPGVDGEAMPARAERGPQEGAAGSSHCEGASCGTVLSNSRASAQLTRTVSHTRNVMSAQAMTDTSALGITIALPVQTVDCGDVLLAVVGAKRAVLGQHVLLQANASGPDGSGDSNAPFTLLWKSDDTELTVVGPTTAEAVCNTIGTHNISVELAPPAPCPATLQVEIECLAPQQ